MLNCAVRISSSEFNRMPSLGEAVSIISKDGHFRNFLNEAARLFVRYKVHEKLGVTLLHQHGLIEHGEELVEFEELHDGLPSLVSKPKKHQTSTPSKWLLKGGQFVGFEYSTDEKVQRDVPEIVLPEGFNKAFRLLVSKYDFARVIGICYPHRRFFENNESGMTPIEFSCATNRSNVVQLLKPEKVDGELIETNWIFEKASDPESATKCKVRCHSQCARVPADIGHINAHQPKHRK